MNVMRKIVGDERYANKPKNLVLRYNLYSKPTNNNDFLSKTEMKEFVKLIINNNKVKTLKQNII